MSSGGKSVDWEAVKRRLSATKRMLADDFLPSPQTRTRILEERAKLLAREPRVVADDITQEILEFSIANRRYAFEAAWVREIVVLKELTPLPCTPSFVHGVVNIRGRIVSAVDLCRFWGLPEKGIVDFHHIIVLRGCDMEFGVLADKVDGVAQLNPKELRQEEAVSLSGVPVEFVKGLIDRDDVLLDAEKLLRDPRMVVNQEIQA